MVVGKIKENKVAYNYCPNMENRRRTMALVDINKYSHCENIPKNIYQERFLSLRARGLLHTIRSLPDDYKISLEKLQLLCKEKPYTIQKTLTELKNNGYISVKKLFPNETQSGRIEWIWSLNRKQKEEDRCQEKTSKA